MPISPRALVALVASIAISAATAARPRDYDYDYDYALDYVDYEPVVEDESNARETRAVLGKARLSPFGNDRNARAPSSAPVASTSSVAPSPGPAVASDPAPAPPAPLDEATLNAFEAERERVST